MAARPAATVAMVTFMLVKRVWVLVKECGKAGGRLRKKVEWTKKKEKGKAERVL